MKRSLERRKSLENDDGSLHLRYYIFDWDDNVVHMPTRIWMEDVATGSAVPLSTSDYALRRSDPALRHSKDAFREFQDGTGDFQADLAKAMGGPKWQAPAYNAFKEAVMEGRLFSIVTARGHRENTLRQAVSKFIDEILTDDEKQAMLQSLREFKMIASEDAGTDIRTQYLNLCCFVGVSNPEFQKLSDTTKTEDGKKYAIRQFVKSTVDMSEEVFVQQGKKIGSISFGMSDDDHKNVEVVDALMRDELSPLYTRVKFVVFNTGGGKVKRLRPHISDPGSISVQA